MNKPDPKPDPKPDKHEPAPSSTRDTAAPPPIESGTVEAFHQSVTHWVSGASNFSEQVKLDLDKARKKVAGIVALEQLVSKNPELDQILTLLFKDRVLGSE